MKRNLLTLLLATAATLAGAQDKQAQPEPAARTGSTAATSTLTPPVDGSTRVGTDSDGDCCEYTFVKGAQLRFHVREGGRLVLHEDAGDCWAQNGNVTSSP